VRQSLNLVPEIEMGPDTPDEYIRKSLTLGWLNVLYGYHLLSIGDTAGALRALAVEYLCTRRTAFSVERVPPELLP
jgi:hypothetical protein